MTILPCGCRHLEVSLVLAVFIVNHNDDASRSQFVNCGFT